MKFLNDIKRPALTITRTKRFGLIDEISNQIVLGETITKIELTIPSVFQWLKDSVISLLMPRMAFA